MNIMSDLFDTQAIDTLEEWAMDDHCPLRISAEKTLLKELGIGFGIEALPITVSSYHYHVNDSKRYRVDGSKDMCMECQYDNGGVDTRKSDASTHYMLCVEDIDLNDRPTEREAFKHCVPGEIRRNWDEQSRAKRSAFVKALDAQHKQFVAQVKIDLTKIYTLTELYTVVDQCIAHDDHLSELAGRSFCDTYAALANDFIDAEVRIRKGKGIEPKAIVVEHVHTQHSVAQAVVVMQFLMKNKEGGRAIASNQRERSRYEAEGWVCVAQRKS